MTLKYVTCQSSNLIYALSCNVCSILYVGETKRRIMDRVDEHLYSIKTNMDTTVARHFQMHGPPTDPPLSIRLLEFIHADPESDRAKILRKDRETVWIARLNSLVPNGLNILD